MFKKVEREKEEALKQAEFQSDIYQINNALNIVCEDNGGCGATDPGPRHLQQGSEGEKDAGLGQDY